MSGFLPPDKPRFTVDRDASGFVVLDDVRAKAGADPAIVSGIETQATAANIVTAMNWHWHWVLSADDEHPEMIMDPVGPALAQLLKAARDMFDELELHSDNAWVDGVSHRVFAFGEALRPFAYLEVPDDRQDDGG